MPSAAEIQEGVMWELEALREIRGLGVREFCASANVGTSTWYDWIALNTSPPLDDLARMAEALQARLNVRITQHDAADPHGGADMRSFYSLEAREVLLLMEKMTPEQRQYVRDVARAVGLPLSPARGR